MTMNEQNRAVLLAALPHARRAPPTQLTPPTPTLPASLNPFEERQLWREYCVLFQANPLKK
jgi:hypothetical protein